MKTSLALVPFLAALFITGCSTTIVERPDHADHADHKDESRWHSWFHRDSPDGNAGQPEHH
jgi:hypothetical protein